MAVSSDFRFELKKVYNFNMKTDVAALLGDQYTLMRVIGIMTSTEARKNYDISTMHEQVKPILDDVSGTSTSDLTWVLFETVDGEKVTYAMEYINLDTVVLVESVDVQAKVYGVSTEDISIIKTRLKELGYTNVDVTTF